MFRKPIPSNFARIRMASPTNSLFMLPLKVGRAVHSRSTPARIERRDEDRIEAWVDCFVAAPDLPSATSDAVYRLNRRKYLIVDFVSARVEQIEPQTWATFIASRYPTTFDQLPSAAEVARIITSGGFFMGPFSIRGNG